MTTILQTLVAGLLIGGVVALLSSGLTLIFGVMRVVNFAQGEFVMLGMYAMVFLAGVTGVAYPAVFAPLLFAAFVALGAALYWLTLLHVTGARFGGTRGHDAQLIMTLGLSLVLQNLALMFFGSKPHLLGSAFTGAWSVGDILFNKPRTVGFAVAAVSIAFLLWMLKGTKTGRLLRATADDTMAAIYMGIDVRRAHMIAFSIGTGLAGVGGGILATFYPTQPYVGEDFIVLMFVAVVLGGLGSVTGAVLGGLAIGMAQAFAPLLLPLDLQSVVVFALFLIVLFLRPQGIFGRAARV
jgi:branched-chain amino acid transport system permease protein